MYNLSKSKIAMLLAIVGVVLSDGRCSSGTGGCLDDSICCSWANLNETITVMDSRGRIWEIEPTTDGDKSGLKISTQKDTKDTWLAQNFPSKNNCVKKLIRPKRRFKEQKAALLQSQGLCQLLKGEVVDSRQCPEKRLITHDHNANVKFEAY